MADEIHDLNATEGDGHQDNSETEALTADKTHDLKAAEGDDHQDNSETEVHTADKTHDLKAAEGDDHQDNSETEVHTADKTLEIKTAEGDDHQDRSELEALTIRIKELVANMLKQETYLKGELATKKEYLASLTVSLDNSNNEIPELQRQLAEMRETNEKYQALIGALRNQAVEQEMQLKEIKKVIGTKEEVITSFSISLENSKTEKKSNEENSVLKAEQKALMKMLKQMQKAERKNAKENAKTVAKKEPKSE